MGFSDGIIPDFFITPPKTWMTHSKDYIHQVPQSGARARGRRFTAGGWGVDAMGGPGSVIVIHSHSAGGCFNYTRFKQPPPPDKEPAAVKGTYVKGLSVSATMSPSVRIAA